MSVTGLPEGTRAAVRPQADGGDGPEVTLEVQPLVVHNLQIVDRAQAGMDISFETSLPARCRLRVRAEPTAVGSDPTGRAGARPQGGAGRSQGDRRGPGTPWLATEWEPSESPDHRLTLPGEWWPHSMRLRIGCRRGDEGVELDLPMDQTHRAGLLEANAARLGRLVAGSVASTLQGAGRIDAWNVDGLAAFGHKVARIDAVLPPAWFLDELGGPAGVLDHPLVALDAKDSFYRAIGWLEQLDAARELLRIPGRYPHERLYGSHFGPSAKTRYPEARPVPVVLAGVDRRLPFQLIGVPLGIHGYELAKRGVWFTEVEGRVRLGRLLRGSRVELHARLMTLPGRYVEAVINRRFHLRLSRPDRSIPATTPCDLFVAFDPAYLVEGENVIRFRDPRMPAVLEGLEAWRGVTVQPPGFVLRVVE